MVEHRFREVQTASPSPRLYNILGEIFQREGLRWSLSNDAGRPEKDRNIGARAHTRPGCALFTSNMQQEREGGKEEEEEEEEENENLDPRPTSSFISYLYPSRFIQPFSIFLILPLSLVYLFSLSLFILPLSFLFVLSRSTGFLDVSIFVHR